MRLSVRLSVPCVMLALLAPTVGADKPRNKKQAFTDAKAAGPDFQLQGEYAGSLTGGEKLAAQVIARGDGEFEAAFYNGGLPGAGWDGSAVIRLLGTADDGLKGKGYHGKLKGGMLTGNTDDGCPFELNRIARRSPTLGAKPPAGSLVLFSGADADQWQKGRLQEGELLAVGTRTKKKFRNFRLHLEFRTPFMPYAEGQARGNSGMYLLDQYECQILDSFGLSGADNECGGIYKVAKPKLNMCLPPLTWQTYDVDFQAARFNADGKKTGDAVVTIRHNGVVIHDKLKLKTTPGGGQQDERPGSLYLQDHRDPVHFQNIWIVEK